MHDGDRVRRAYLRDPLSLRILACTRELIAEVGVRNATMNAIAQRAGCGKPTVYKRWANLDALTHAALDDLTLHDDVRERFTQAVAAADALVEMPEGRFLFEVAVLPSARERLEGP